VIFKTELIKMYLIGNVNFENLTYDAKGMLGEVEVKLVLPRILRNRTRLKLKYFGYHAGLAADNPDYVAGVFSLDENAFPSKYQDYVYRHHVKEIQMRVFDDEGSIMHDNVISHIVDDVNGMTVDDSKHVDYISFPATKECQAQHLQGATEVANNFANPASVIRGYSKMHDLELGFVEASSSFVNVKLTALPLAYDDALVASVVSGEPNVRMDSVSFVMELK